MREAKYPALDWFRLAAAVLVVMIHTSPLTSYTALGDFWLTRVLARVAVPFFLMTSGYFLARNNWSGAGRQIKKLLALYGVCVLLYLPLNWYNGGFGGPAAFLKKLLIDGTFYHLWYFPAAILGIAIAKTLSRLGLYFALLAAVCLYLIGLGGDSYFDLVSQVPILDSFYSGLFSLCSYTRNGLFYAPLFLLLGAAGRRWSHRVSLAGFVLSLALMSGEGLWLHALAVQRHDSMYLALPLCMVFLFSLLLGINEGQRKEFRALGTLVFIIHPWCIVLVRGAAKALGLETLLINNSLAHFLAVLALSVAISAVCLLRPKRVRPTARAWREIDLAALAHNARVLRGCLASGTELMAVVKADAYGHGAVPIARTLRRQGIRAFAVACLSEGIALRRAGIRGTILILGYTAPEDAPLLARWHLTQTVADVEHGLALAAQGKKLHVHLALDIGMHRLGIPANDHEGIAKLFGLPSLVIDGTFSHLCAADSLTAEDTAYTEEQLNAFYDTVAWMRSAGYDPGRLHIQSSYGIWNLPPQPCCAYARPGIGLYGVSSDGSPVRHPLDLRPVLSLRARVASVRTLEPGETAGYSRAWRAERRSRLAAVTIGYADGLPRDLPQRGGEVLIHGQRCPMAGRMCMDQLLVDVTGLEVVQSNDVVTLIGQDGGQVIRAEELAERCGTITNELLSRLGNRLGLTQNLTQNRKNSCGVNGVDSMKSG